MNICYFLLGFIENLHQPAQSSSVRLFCGFLELRSSAGLCGLRGVVTVVVISMDMLEPRWI
jgi:hypothetical protein